MSKFEYEIGDVVILSSGGSSMTIESVEDRSVTKEGCIVGSPIHTYTVVWLRDDGDYQEAKLDGRVFFGRAG